MLRTIGARISRARRSRRVRRPTVEKALASHFSLSCRRVVAVVSSLVWSERLLSVVDPAESRFRSALAYGEPRSVCLFLSRGNRGSKQRAGVKKSGSSRQRRIYPVETLNIAAARYGRGVFNFGPYGLAANHRTWSIAHNCVCVRPQPAHHLVQ
jgi:hypothetical protein